MDSQVHKLMRFVVGTVAFFLHFYHQNLLDFSAKQTVLLLQDQVLSSSKMTSRLITFLLVIGLYSLYVFE